MSKTALEAWANTIIGFIVSWLITYFVFPLFGMYPSVSESFEVSMVFFFISFSRSYLLRVFFKWIG